MNNGKKASWLRRSISAFAMLTALATVAITARGQEPRRVQFEKGRSSATVQGTTGKYGTSYVIRARSGQKLLLTLKPASGIGIKVETNGRFGQSVLLREEHGGRFEAGLEESGDYTIFVGSARGKNTPFTLTIAIARMTDI